jgi:hypothetical protein
VATTRNAKATRPRGGILAAAAFAVTALVLGLLIASVALTALTGDLNSVSYGAGLLVPLVVLGVGSILASRRPSNPIGWLTLATAFALALEHASRLYAVLDYYHHNGRLQLGAAAVFLADTAWPYGFVLLAIVLLLFPDGVVPSRRWRAVLGLYVAACSLVMAGFYVEEVAVIRGPFRVDPVSGQSSSSVSLHGASALIYNVAEIAAAGIPVFMIACVGRLVASWRDAGGDRRQQLKWLLVGAAAGVAGAVLNFVANAELHGTAQHALNVASNLAIAVLPACLGIAVLRYRLYDIDRLISRTLSYALLSGILLAVFAALVLLTTRVLPFSSAVGVAASTLAAAALFNPLRTRTQRLLDRRFNRARYDAEATVAAFSGSLRNAVDPDTISGELLDAVEQTLSPAHATIWIRPGSPGA